MSRLLIGLTTCIFLAATALIAAAAPLLQSSFTDGAAGWTGTDQAVVSEIGRRAGTRSLLIKQWKDEESDSCWVSPAIPANGKPVTISFWAADNYRTCTDFSYSACVNAISYRDGKEAGISDYLAPIVWDNERKESMWGQFLPAGLVWKYYQRVFTPSGDSFRLKFHWPKQIIRGDCYLTDVLVTEATPEEIAASAVGVKDPSAGKMEGKLALEISTPVSGNLFYTDDPLRFDVLVYTRDQSKLELPPAAKLEYAITDYQHFAVAKGTLDFAGAGPVTVEDFAKTRQGEKRKANLYKEIVIPDASARETGREFFLEMRLVSEGKTLAADTVTYGVVNPRPIEAKDYDKCRFSITRFEEFARPAWRPDRSDAIAVKTGASWAQIYDYSWVKFQPHYPGPITFPAKLPPFPKITFCPNIEQERPNVQWIKDEVPPEAIIPDPLHPGRITFNIDAYVEYIVAYIRYNREAIARVVPSGLERPIDARTLELHRKAYAAIKKEFPDLPVGFMLYGLPMNPSADVDIFLREKLYECCDFIDTHVYASSVDWSEWERLQAEYKKMNRPVPPLYSTEFARVGGMDQVQRSRDMIAAHLDAFAHGMQSLYYFNQHNTSYDLAQPFLREPTDLGGDQTSGFMYIQMIERPKPSTLINMQEQYKPHRWTIGGFPGDSLMPLLQTMTYYNLVQNFEAAEFRKVVNPDDKTVAYIFDRPDATVVGIWLQKPVGASTILVKSPVDFRAQDLYGRTERMAACASGVLLTIDDNPLILTFEKRVENLEILPVSGGMATISVARGGKGNAEIVLPGAWNYGGKVNLTATVDGAWPGIKEQAVTLEKGKDARIALPFTVDLNRTVGDYTLTARITSADGMVGLLKAPLKISELLTVAVDTVPLTRKTGPAIRVTISSLKETPTEGTVTLDDRYFTTSLRNRVSKLPFKLAPRGKTEVIFPLDRECINLTTSYDVAVTVEDTAGARITRQEEIGFRACEKAPGPITIDGDLADWKLAERTAIPFSRAFSGWRPYNGPDDCSGVLYSLWDAGTLYFAAVVKDDHQVSRHNDIDLWTDDNIMLGLYPWRWRRDEPLKSGYYREHLGLCADGTARIFRVGNVAAGPANDEGTKIAVKRTADGYIYEWAYSAKSVLPLELKPGGGFRLSLFTLDADPGIDSVGGISLGGFNENVDARPVRWREFILVE